MGHRDLYSNLIIFRMFQKASEMACSKFICSVYPIDEVGFFKYSISIHNTEIG